MKIDNLFIQMHHVNDHNYEIYRCLLLDFKSCIRTAINAEFDEFNYPEVRNLLDIIDEIDSCLKLQEEKECTSSTTGL